MLQADVGAVERTGSGALTVSKSKVLSVPSADTVLILHSNFVNEITIARLVTVLYHFKDISALH
jgi:hypothetical protein